MKFETRAIHAGRTAELMDGVVAPGIALTTTFPRGADGSFAHGHVYARTSNPNRSALESCLADLEGGADAAAFASGSAATFAMLHSLAPGDHVLAPDDMYHGTRTQLRDLLSRWNLHYSETDFTDLAAVRRSLRPETRLVWIETPSNPLLKVSNIEALTDLARASRAVSVVDNTFASPVLQRPLELGADFVLHSTTKYFGGHSDVLGGAVIARESGAIFARVRDFQCKAGAVPAPFDCWLLLRSICTLPYRVRAQAASAQAVAEYLVGHPSVEAVHYPGLPSHPGHALALRQMSAPGAMLSFQLAGGVEAAMRVAGHVRLFTRATSLGGVESLIEHRASVEGAASTTPRNLLRVSVGLEHVDDLIEDLRDALAAGGV